MNSSNERFSETGSVKKGPITMGNTRVEYQYRGRSNSKVSNTLVLKGIMSEKDRDTLLQLYGEGTEGFDPSRMRGVRPMGSTTSTLTTEIAKPTHEISLIELTSTSPDSDLTVEMFLADIMRSVC
jgi:hypothetical protein